MSRSFLESFRTRSSATIFSFLIAVSVLTWLVGKWDIGRLDEVYDQYSLEKRTEAISLIQRSLDETFADLNQEARSLAAREDVLESMRILSIEGSPPEEIVDIAAEFDLDPLLFMEIYDPTPSLIAWKGAVFPMDSAVRDERFMLEALESVVRDGDTRTALIVWVPITEGESILGAIRFGQIVEKRMPLKNDYLRDFSWDEEWSRKLGQTVTFDFVAQNKNDGDYVLRSPGDKRIGNVTIQDAKLVDFKSDKRARYNDLLAFWLFLMLIYVISLVTARLWSQLPAKKPSSILRSPIPGYLLLLVFSRGMMLFMDIPSRWQSGKAPLAPLFDPQHLASVFGFGSMRTVGDLMISALILTLAALIILRRTTSVRHRTFSSIQYSDAGFSLRLLAGLVGHQFVMLAVSVMLFQVSNHAVVDSTLDLFERSGLIPDKLVLIVFSALLMIVFSMVLLGGRMLWILLERMDVEIDALPSKLNLLLVTVATTAGLSLLLLIFDPSATLVPIEIFLLTSAVIFFTALTGPLRPAVGSPIVVLRRLVPIVIVTSIVLFPMLEESSTRTVEMRMLEAAESFLDERDSRVMFAISQVMDNAESAEFLQSLKFLTSSAAASSRSSMDSLAESTTRGFLLSALASYDVTITLFSTQGVVSGRYSNLTRRLPRAMLDEVDVSEYDLFSSMYADFGGTGSMIEKLTGSTDQNRFRYAGFQELSDDGIILVRAEQRPITESAGTPFPEVLSPAGYYGDRYADFSIAEFQDGVLVRSEGKKYGRSVLGREVQRRLQAATEAWVGETVRERDYQTYYRVEESLSTNAGRRVTAVRRRTTNIFDQLYHLLRIVVAGLILATPVYLGGFLFRWKRAPSETTVRPFRDKVLNAFFSVGIVTVVAMGFVGLQVVTGENERAIESWLRQHLDRVEDTLKLETKGEELPYRVLDRISVDSLAARVGLDLVVYHNLEVEQASRPELIRDRLIERRLPIEAYEALYYEGFKFVTVEEKLGSFSYTAGYRAMTDERGVPHYVVSIPTLPEQERIEEERARTVAYLFGALLLLVLVVMVTASLLADALTRPIAQLRAGLKAVAAGHFERITEMDSGDEIADLVDSFNTMQEQLEESQSLLGKQERQLAWREMARQVAHEIKNPLTPMKLSIQHLRSAFERRSEDGSDDAKFSGKFAQTTTTLIEQIDTLARIANEFSSFGRMPTHIREEIDLNAVITEAVELMQAEDNVSIELDLSSERLVIHGDREALRRVYVNFIKNAIQSVPEDRIVEITVRTSTEDSENGTQWVLGSVTDNGAGIPRNLWDKIFVPSFSTKTSGTGLGLAIARKTIESMDGEIGFDTQFGEGTTFWIKIPFNSRI